MNLPASILLSMAQTNHRLLRFALLFREYAITAQTDWHKQAIAHYSEIRSTKVGEKKCTTYLLLGRKHRESGPAQITTLPNSHTLEIWYRHGREMWSEDTPSRVITKENGSTIVCFLQNSNFHRLTGPAYITSEGVKHWFVHGVRHRLDGPAIDNRDYKKWIVNGQTHRINGPAVIKYNHLSEAVLGMWYIKGKLHRINEPAVICLDENYAATCISYMLHIRIPLKPHKMWFTNHQFQKFEII